MSLHFTSSKHQIDLIKLPLILKQIIFCVHVHVLVSHTSCSFVSYSRGGHTVLGIFLESNTIKHTSFHVMKL